MNALRLSLLLLAVVLAMLTASVRAVARGWSTP